MIIIISGEPSTGKTWNAMQWIESITYLDLEKRGTLTIKQFLDKLIDLKDLKQFTNTYRDDYYASYLAFKHEVELFLKTPKEELPQTLVVDGISDVRNYLALAKWQHDTGKTKPGEFTWGIINDIAKDLVSPLINMATVHGFDLVLTAQFTNDYAPITVIDDRGRSTRKNAKCGRIPATKDWQDYGVNVLVRLSTRKRRYYAEIVKSPVGMDEFEITGKSLYEELLERDL